MHKHNWWHRLRRWCHRRKHKHEFTKFTIVATPIEKQHKEKQNMDLQIFDDGKGVKFVATPDHPLRADEKPSWDTKDPSVLVITQDLENDPSGLTAIGRFPDPVKDVNQFVATTISCTRDSDGVVVTDDAPPINIVPNPNTDVGGFVIEASAL